MAELRSPPSDASADDDDWELLPKPASLLSLPLQQEIEAEQTHDLADEQNKSEGFGAAAMAGPDTSFPSGHGEGASVGPLTEGWRPHRRAMVSGVPFQENYSEVCGSEEEQDDEGPLSLAEEDIEPLVGLSHEELVAAEETAQRSITPALDVTVAVSKVSWWKRQIVLWQPQPRKSSAVWSIALVAAVVGIVVIGHRWQRQRFQNRQLRLVLSAKEEKLNDLIYQVNQMKEVMTGRHRVGVTRNSIF